MKIKHYFALIGMIFKVYYIKYLKKMKEIKCPLCKHKIDSHTGVNNKMKPKIRDFTVCFYCGEILKFQSSEKLIAVLPTDLIILATVEPSVYKQLKEVQLLIHQKPSKN